MPVVRKGQGAESLSREEFERRARQRYYDPNFAAEADAVERVIEVAWSNYHASRKSPLTRRAGSGFADPDYQLSVEWLETRDRIQAAAGQHADVKAKSRVLLICAAARNDQTCPGEMSKSFRLAQIAKDALATAQCDVDLLDLSALSSEYGRVIHPCKACVSTAMPLCHWPCSCYPNHSLGQAPDWMNELYPRWVAAHGVLIVTPVYWYQAPSGLKLMLDRLVCADGGNPDPSSTHGKDPAKAKALELKGWSYPRHLAGRAFGLVVHGDAEGTDVLRRALSDWLTDMKLVQAGGTSIIDRYIGYYKPYATSHEALDLDTDIQQEVRNVARSVAQAIKLIRGGRCEPDEGLEDPRQK
ncbi:MAG TPA: NAD(P)H-dependent oxidoreductase [Steroidobacteraceae bacterium]